MAGLPSYRSRHYERIKFMPELHFKGKEYVYNHHLTVPYRPLVAHSDKSIGDASENLVIHGDNLHALKALLPRYAGKVDCIVIDPPYNTGNENWRYNDNVNSPVMKEWLDGSPVNKEDMLRHDKWCCMMYPRLKLLHELLSENGSFWMTLDDNEIHRTRMMMDEVFGEENFIAAVAWRKRYTRSNNARMFYSQKDYVLSYRKSEILNVIKEPRTDKSDSTYSNPDNDPKGPWMTASYVNPATKEQRKNLVYPIKNPFTKRNVEHPVHAWKYGPEEHARHVTENKLWWGTDGKAEYPRLKLYLDEAEQLVPVDFWDYSEVGSSDDGSEALKHIFGQAVFDNPKPVDLIQKILTLLNNTSALVLDSFAGSATTAHAVLAQNAKDGGNRRFILVECEDYADTLTAERVRRVINGYEYQGTQREELLRAKITWSNFSRNNAHKRLLGQVQSLENLESARFDRIQKAIKDSELIVTGEKKITEKMEGLGGGFTYYTLGDPLDLDKMLTGEGLPDYASIGAWLFHTATGEPMDLKKIKEKQSYLGQSEAFHVWLIYKPSLDFLKSSDAALTLTFAETIAKKKNKRHLVFAPARVAPNKMLLPLGVEYAPLPFALYRFEKE